MNGITVCVSYITFLTAENWKHINLLFSIFQLLTLASDSCSHLTSECDSLLLQSIQLKLRHVVLSEMLFCLSLRQRVDPIAILSA